MTISFNLKNTLWKLFMESCKITSLWSKANAQLESFNKPFDQPILETKIL